jgi:hypothetical protein
MLVRKTPRYEMLVRMGDPEIYRRRAAELLKQAIETGDMARRSELIAMALMSPARSPYLTGDCMTFANYLSTGPAVA